MARIRAAAALFAIGAAAAAVAAAAPASAGLLVVRSAGPSSGSYGPGRSLPDAARVTLQPGDVLVLLAGDATRTLRGPGTFSLGNLARSGPAPTVTQRRGRFSALRNAGIVPRSPTIWHVDATQAGKLCLSDRNQVTLWRPEADEAGQLTITAPGGESATTEWAAGQETLAWPQSLPIVDDAEYQLSWGETSNRLRFTTLASTPSDVESVAQALIEKGCSVQLDMLIETVPGAPADPG